MKLVKIDSYLLLINEEAEINKKDIFINTLDNSLNEANDWIYVSTCKKVIAYYPLTKEAEELDLPLFPVTPKDKWGVHETHCCEKHGCKYGDNDCCVEIGVVKAKYPCEYCDDDENDKQFSLEDMQKAFEAGEHKGHCEKGRNERSSYESRNYNTFKEFIQSLSTQQLPKEFIPTLKGCMAAMDTNICDNCDNSCKELKTIINSEGKEELVGSYK